MTDHPHDPEAPAPPAPPPDRPARRLPPLAWLVAVLLLGVVAWGVAALSRPAPGPAPASPTPSTQPSPAASGTPAAATPDAGPPATLPGSGATFTPLPGTTLNGPHVLGITAGVGLEPGVVAGVAPIAVGFSEAMDGASAQAAFALQPAAAGTFRWQQNTLLFVPNAPLAPGTVYTATLGAGAKTASGTNLAAPLSASFKTAAPPAILRTLPTAGAAEVPTDTIVTITFNHPMIPLTALESQPDPGAWVTVSPAVAGRWVWLGTAAAGFRADNGFAPATGFTVAVKAGWPDAAGVPLAQGANVSFTTIRPAILSVSPPDGASDVPIDAPLVVRFNQPLDHASTAQALALQVTGSNAALPGSFAWAPDSTVLTFTPASRLEFGQAYSALLGPGIRPAGGTAALTAPAGQWQFHTTAATYVVAHSPGGDGGQPAPPATGFGFNFNNPLAPGQDVAQYLTVSPAPQGYANVLAIDASGTGVLTDGVALLPNTVYTFTLKAGLRDKWGFPVAPATWQVPIGPLPPSLAILGGSSQPIYTGGPTRVRLQTANLQTVTLRLYEISDADLRDLVQGTRPSTNPPTYPGRLLRQWDVAVPGDPHGLATSYPVVAPDAASDRLPPGYYLLRATAPTPYNDQPLEQAVTLIAGHTGLVTKNAGPDLLVWAADLGSGRPVPNYPLRIEQWLPNDQLPAVQHGHTGADGVWRGQLPKNDGFAIAVWGEQPDDAAFVSSNWGANLDPGGFGLAGGAGGGPPIRAALYTDRPIYRPGQTVYFRGVYRQDADAQYSLLPAGTPITLRASTYGNQGEVVVYNGTAQLGALSTLAGQFALPADAAPGDYTLAGGDASAQFSVQEYRKPDFQVDVSTLPAVVHGDPLTATVQTSYYFGGPLANITTTVNLRSDPYCFSWTDPDTSESYTFGENCNPRIFAAGVDEAAPMLGGAVAGRGSGFPIPTKPGAVQSFQARTDANGLLTVDVSGYVTTTDGSKTLLVEGQVQDLSNQAVANRANVVVHQGAYYIGLRAGDYIATAQQPATITVRTVAPLPGGGGRAQPNTAVTLRFLREEWTSPPYGSNEQPKLNEVPAGQATVTTDAAGRAVSVFTPPQGGEYRVVAEGTDSHGNTVRTALGLWASSDAPGAIPWQFSNETQVRLVPDKTRYAAGDTAHILVTSPFSQATALLTVERGQLRRYRIVTLTGGAPVVDVPLEAGDLPNVYIGLTLLGPAAPPAGAPADWTAHVALRQGYANLPLDTTSRRLQISVDPAGPGPFLPGSTVTMTVHTRDSGGHPAAGELSLALVDEAIFALQTDSGGDLFDSFWAPRGSDVRTASSFSAGDYFAFAGVRGAGGATASAGIAGLAPQAAGVPRAAADQVANAAAPAAPQTVRSNFQDTAFWAGAVRTGPDGTASVAVPLPDNLTTWRLSARGVTADTRAGQASSPLTVTQPLLLRPVQPRFLISGDNPHPQAIVHNNSGRPLAVQASLAVSGALTLDAQPPATQLVTVAPGAETVVTWSARVGAGDVAHLRYWVHTAGTPGTPDYLEDALAADLPVLPFAAPEAVATSGEVAGTRADESVFLPYSVNPLLGELVVQVAPSLAAAATDSIRYVRDYPYDSTDQTVSRFLPLVTLEQVYNEQGLKTPYAPALPGIVSAALRRLGALQQPDGGWGWWERGPSDWWETAYVVQGLAAARDAGYAVPGDLLQRGVERLRNFASANDTPNLDETYHLNMRAYTLYVLGLAGGQDAQAGQQANDLVAQAARLSNHARTWLALGLASAGQADAAKGVLATLESAARESSTTAHWEETQPDYWSMGTDNRATALAIDALVTLDPGNPLIPKAVRWLMSAERDGHWLSTQETAISLVSLAHYIRQTKELQANYTWQVSLFDKLLGQGVANATTLTQTTTLRLPVAGLPPNTLGDLALARSAPSGKLYYQLSLRYYVPGQGIAARSEGLAITRSYYAMAGGATGPASAAPISTAAAGDLIRVRLTLVAPETAYYVLVTDPLPAGLEGVNGSLATTSFTEHPPNPAGSVAGAEGPAAAFGPWFDRWGPFDNVAMRDTETVLFAHALAPGTYVYDYFARATTPGVYLALPARAALLYYPDVFGRSDGGTFTVR